MVTKLPNLGTSLPTTAVERLNNTESSRANTDAQSNLIPVHPVAREPVSGKQRLLRLLNSDGNSAKRTEHGGEQAAVTSAGNTTTQFGRFKNVFNPLSKPKREINLLASSESFLALQADVISARPASAMLLPSQNVATHLEATTKAFFLAIKDNDTDKVEHLINSGAKPYGVDAKGISPVCFLINEHTAGNLDEESAFKLYRALCKSSNPTAPEGYTKPFAQHGTWNLGDIMKSGGLKGTSTPGSHHGDFYTAKKIFLTTPTRLLEQDTSIRNGRNIARAYAKAEVLNMPAFDDQKAYSIYAQAFAVLDSENKIPANMIKIKGTLTKEIFIRISQDQNRDEMMNEAVVKAVTERIEKALIELVPKNDIREIPASDYQNFFENVKVPSPVMFCVNNRDMVSLEVSRKHIETAVSRIRNESTAHETSLAALNKGEQVPAILGFSPVINMQNHQIQAWSRLMTHQYREEALPFAGDSNGGKTTEIEMRSPEHLATLLLHSQLEDYVLPPGIVIRLKKNVISKGSCGSMEKKTKTEEQKTEKAKYVSGEQLVFFNEQIKSKITKFVGNTGVSDIKDLTRLQRQDLNDHLQDASSNILMESLQHKRADFSNSNPMPGIT